MFLVFLYLQVPPRHIVIEAGAKGGSFDTTALLLKNRLEEKGISISIINREETLGIIGNVNRANIVLDEYGITPESSTYVELSLRQMADALSHGDIDVGFFLQPTNNKIVAEIGTYGI